MHGKMAESEKVETDGSNEVNDPPAWEKDALQTKCLKNDGRQLDSPVKEEMVGLMKSFRASFKLVSEKSPLTSKNKKSVRTSNDQKQPSNSPLQPPPSPSFSTRSPSQFSQQSSPLQNKKTSLTRTMSDSAVAITGTLVKRGTLIRQSLGLGTKKCKQEPLEPVTEAITSPEEQKPEDVDEVLQLRETYILPDIPPMPLSVMEINKLIEMEVLEEAYVNLLSLRLELQHEHQALEKGDCPVELVHKEKDLCLLYGTLRNKMSNITRNSSALPSRNKELLVYVARIILEEEKRQGEPGGMPGWREAWRDAVREGVRDTLKKVHLDSREQNPSWLAVHLGLLGKAIVEDLERVKAELLSSYPEDFKVFDTYVSCHHEALGEHLKRLLEQVTEVKDYYALLEFIHCYPSEKIIGSFPFLSEEQRGLKLPEDFLNKIKNSLYHRLKEDFTAALENIIKIEREEVWRIKKTPDRTDDRFLTSKIHMDISQLIATYADTLRNVDENLGKSLLYFSLEEINTFLKRFEKEFSQNTCSLLTSDLLDSSLWVEYHITYMNSFNLLKEDMLCYSKSCSDQVEQLEKEVDGLTQRLSQTLIEHFKADIKPYINGMMTKKWLQTDEDFNEVIYRIESYSGYCKSMRNPSAQLFVNDVHYYIVKEYVSQLMMQKYSCKNTKKEDAAIKIKEQWNELKKLFEEMGSSFHWLYSVGYLLSDIIGMDNLKNIKDILNPLVSDYPDISEKQLSAILNFRGTGFGLEKRHVIKQFILLKRDAGNTNHEHSFFADMK